MKETEVYCKAVIAASDRVNSPRYKCELIWPHLDRPHRTHMEAGTPFEWPIMDSDRAKALAELVNVAKDRAGSNKFIHYCKMYCSSTDTDDRRGVRREIEVNIEQEHGDMGTVLSSYHVFVVTPACEGPHDYDSSDGERRLELCPFGMDDDYYDHPEVIAVLGRMRERAAFKRVLEGRSVLDDELSAKDR